MDLETFKKKYPDLTETDILDHDNPDFRYVVTDHLLWLKKNGNEVKSGMYCFFTNEGTVTYKRNGDKWQIHGIE